MKILVVGDSILDKYVFGSVDRVNPEAPTLVLDFQEEIEVLGGACNVAANIRTLSNKENLAIDYFGMASSKMVQMLGSFSVSFAGVACEERDILTKTRFVSSNHHLLRLDKNKRYDQELCLVAAKLVKKFNIRDYDLVVISDYDKGTVSQELCEHIFIIANGTIPVLFDLKRKRDWIFDLDLSNCIIKCNKKEFDENGVSTLLYSDARDLVVTNGKYGYFIMHPFPHSGGEHKAEEYRSIKLNGNTSDVVGAGDTFLAGMAVSFLEAKQFDVRAMTEFGNKCAASKVKNFGTKAVKRDEV